ncbi:MAG TPA: TonB family protein [Candidatus Kapabacteria bacterium]|nr:TonB family protein [Candidatus Kapabacteria bacterium]
MMRRTVTILAIGALLLAGTAAGLLAQERQGHGGRMPASPPARWAPVIRFGHSADDMALFATTIGYPPATHAGTCNADVVVRVDVDTSGTCSGAVVISGGRAFDDSVMAALRRAAFEPGHAPWDSVVPTTFGLRVCFRTADTGAASAVTVYEVNADDAAMWARRHDSVSLRHAASTPASDRVTAPHGPRARARVAAARDSTARRSGGSMRADAAEVTDRPPERPVSTSVRLLPAHVRLPDDLDTLYPSGVTIPRGVPRYAPPDFDLGVLRARVTYPEDAKLHGVEGTVYVEAHIDRSGALAQARVVHSDSPMLNDAALEAVRGTQFRAAHRYDEPVDASVIIPIAFRLK